VSHPGDSSAQSGTAANDLSPLQYLDSEGRLHGDVMLTSEQAVDALRWMLLSRALDELAIKLQRLKRIGLYAPVDGQEASVVGSALALDPARDWMVPASREQVAMVRHGLPLLNLLAGYMGRLDHAGIPEGVRLLPRQQAIAAQLPHAAGIAWALRLRGERAAVLVYCGDGASSEGDFHEALNLAGVVRAPLVVVLINNRYAISTPISKQTAARDLSVRARGYGFPGVAVDGNDVFAVHRATWEGVQRALGGGGPTLIECRTYRMGFHNTSDNPREYRSDAEVELARRLDPIARLRRHLVSASLLSEAEVEALEARQKRELREVLSTVTELPRPGSGSIFSTAYAALPSRLAQQQRDFNEGRT
jgi:pyruvate dehydrogenase E1 component alpha subunit